MISFSFKNFRQFQNFDELYLSPITIFVGKNNSGKSTIIKFIEFIYNLLTLKEAKSSFFSQELFRNNRVYFENDISSFKRAVYNNDINRTIIFNVKDRFNNILNVEISNPSNKNNRVPYGIITKLNYYCSDYKTQIESDFKNNKVKITFEPSNDYNQSKDLNDFESIKNPIEKYFQLINKKICVEINTEDIFSLKKIMNEWKDSEFDYLKKLLQDIGVLIRNFVDDKQIRDNPQYKDICWFIDSYRRFNKAHHYTPVDFYFPFKSGIMKYYMLEKIQIHDIPNSGLFNLRESNNKLTKVISVFINQGITKAQHDFIIKWMKLFKIGYDIKFKSIEGDFAIIYIIIDEDGTKVNLLDLGTGGINLIMLLLEIAYFLENYDSYIFKATLVIEEPEQNLHPKFQSMFADLLLETHNLYGINFIVETHSEYLIRKTQSLVKQMNFVDEKTLNEKCPFGVYYIDGSNIDKPYYKMEYRTDGNFSNEFGSGFYDESTKLLYELL